MRGAFYICARCGYVSGYTRRRLRFNSCCAQTVVVLRAPRHAMTKLRFSRRQTTAGRTDRRGEGSRATSFFALFHSPHTASCVSKLYRHLPLVDASRYAARVTLIHATPLPLPPRGGMPGVGFLEHASLRLPARSRALDNRCIIGNMLYPRERDATLAACSATFQPAYAVAGHGAFRATPPRQNHRGIRRDGVRGIMLRA